MLLALLCLTPFRADAQAQPAGIAIGGDNLTRLLWNSPDGTASFWKLDTNGNVTSQNSYGPYAGWQAQGFAAGPDSAPRVLWNHTADGTLSLWNVTPDANFTYGNYGPYTGYTAFRVAAGPNSVPRTLWNKSDGSISLWYSTADAADYTHSEYGPYSGYSATLLTVDSTNTPRIVWNHPSDGTISLWKVAGDGTFTYQNFTNPVGYSPVALAAGTGGDVRLLWGNGQGGAIVWTIQQSGSYAQTYPNPYPTASSITVSPSTITAGNTATGTVYLSGPAPSGTLLNLVSTNSIVHVPDPVSVPTNAFSVSFPVTTSSGSYDYTRVVLIASVIQNSTVRPNAPITVYTPGGTPTGGGGGGTGGGGGGTGGGGGGTGGGGTGGGGTGGGGTGGGGTATAGVNPHGYYSVTYSYSDGGGSLSPDGASGITTPTVAYDPAYGDYVDSGSVHFSGSHGSGATAYMSGTFTATFTWHGDADHPNSLPPAQVTVIKRSVASWNGAYYANISGNCSTGLTQRHQNAANPNNSDSLTEYGYETKGGATFSVSCSPSAGVSYTSSTGYFGPNASAYAGTSFTAAAVVMNLSGTTPDANGVDNILVGQRCTASFSTLPTGLTGKLEYKWIVGGTIFKSWNGDSGTVPVSVAGIGPLNQSTANWC